MPLRPTYPLETSRLRLRPLREGDADALLDYHSSPDVHQFLPMGPMDAQVVHDRITSGPWSWTTLESDGDSIALGVELMATGELVGDVMLAWVSSKNQCGEIGYVLNPRHSGHGYATEAANELLRLGFGELGFHRVIARVVAQNGPSIALAERLGMRLEGRFFQSWRRGDEWMDEVHLGILRGEWDARGEQSGSLEPA